jgi:hypothetical protein
LKPAKLGKFGGGLDEVEAHGDGVIELHALTIATPLLFFLLPSCSSPFSFLYLPLLL